MSKKIRLTYLVDTKTIVEEVYLFEEGDKVYVNDAQAGSIEIDNNDIFEHFFKQGLVLFEDEVGMFGLPTNRIVSIEELI